MICSVIVSGTAVSPCFIAEVDIGGPCKVVLLTMEECNAMMGDDYPADN